MFFFKSYRRFLRNLSWPAIPPRWFRFVRKISPTQCFSSTLFLTDWFLPFVSLFFDWQVFTHFHDAPPYATPATQFPNTASPTERVCSRARAPPSRAPARRPSMRSSFSPRCVSGVCLHPLHGHGPASDKGFSSGRFHTPVQPRKQESQPGVSLAPSRPLSMLEIIPPTRFVRHQPLPSVPGGIPPRLRKTVVGHRFRLRISEFPPCHFSHFELSELWGGYRCHGKFSNPQGGPTEMDPQVYNQHVCFGVPLDKGFYSGGLPPTSLFSSAGTPLPKNAMPPCHTIYPHQKIYCFSHFYRTFQKHRRRCFFELFLCSHDLFSENLASPHPIREGGGGQPTAVFNSAAFYSREAGPPGGWGWGSLRQALLWMSRGPWATSRADEDLEKFSRTPVSHERLKRFSVWCALVCALFFLALAHSGSSFKHARDPFLSPFLFSNDLTSRPAGMRRAAADPGRRAPLGPRPRHPRALPRAPGLPFPSFSPVSWTK